MRSAQIPPCVWRLVKSRGGLLVVALCLALSCGPSKGKGKVGAFCDNDADCESGLCFENQCLDPDGDEDGDGLKNGIEVHELGTNPLKADTDDDGTPDLDEVGDIRSPTDTDGDKLIDAVESSLPLADEDRDCLPDQYDPNNKVPDQGMGAKIAQLFCQKGGGVCKDYLADVVATCTEGSVHCDYSGVIDYEEAETRCDRKDNDCDGRTDVGLTSTTQGTCETKGVCGTSGILRECVDGKWVCRYADLPAWEKDESRFDGLDNDCDGETDEGMAGQPCENKNQFGTCPGTMVFRDGAVVCDGRLPAAESCDAIDNDCDGETDEDLTTTTEGTCSTLGVCGAVGQPITRVCRQGEWVCQYEKVPHYQADESACDDKDNDCDGMTDEGLAGVACEKQNQYGVCVGTTVCDGQGGVICAASVPTAEACDGEDNDCDGSTDEFTGGAICENRNWYGTCPGETVCIEGNEVCDGPIPSNDICNGIDDNCDGQTDENDVCLKTSSVKGTVRDGTTGMPVPGARVDVFASGLGGKPRVDRQEEPNDTIWSDDEGRFEVFLIPGPYWLTVEATGYQRVHTWTFVLWDKDTMPLDIALTPVDYEKWFVSVCGRVYDGKASSPDHIVSGVSVTLHGGGLNNPLASALSGPQGFYCISGVSGFNASGSAFEGFALTASKSEYLPAIVEDLPNYPNTVVIRDIFLSARPAGTYVFLYEGFENSKTEWGMDEPTKGVGWHLLDNGLHMNSALGSCVLPPALFEMCQKDPDDPLDQCAVCVDPSKPACIPHPGAIPNAYSGTKAMWFGNPKSGNFLAADGTCESLSGGTGGPVGGSLVSPPIQISYAYPLYLSFYSAWEIESVDPQGPPDGFDQMLIEVQVQGSNEWVRVGHLNPAVDVNGEAYQPYSSGGFNQAPIWVNYVFDLTQFSNFPSIRIRFRFDSKDEQYNGFRGWLVDDVEVFGVLPVL